MRAARDSQSTWYARTSAFIPTIWEHVFSHDTEQVILVARHSPLK